MVLPSMFHFNLARHISFCNWSSNMFRLVIVCIASEKHSSIKRGLETNVLSLFQTVKKRFIEKYTNHFVPCIYLHLSVTKDFFYWIPSISSIQYSNTLNDLWNFRSLTKVANYCSLQKLKYSNIYCIKLCSSRHWGKLYVKC